MVLKDTMYLLIGLGTGETDPTTTGETDPTATDDDNRISEGVYCAALFPGSHLCSDVLNHF